MKVNQYLQYHGKEIQMTELEKRVKDAWKEQGNLVKDLQTIDLYVKVEENTCYYVVNGSVSGSIPVEA